MWLNVRWYDGNDGLIHEDGAYGPMTVWIDGVATIVQTLLDLDDPRTKVYEAHYAMTQEWAAQLLALGYPGSMPLSYDRMTGAVSYTLSQLASQQAGTHHETFHFVLNNLVAKDNRIPPYGFRFDLAKARNALPVPADQYGNPGPGGMYHYWDEWTLDPPANAEYASLRLLYQPTSWEYVQFLDVANTGRVAFLANEGEYLLDAWMNTGMATPYVMTSATWGSDSTAELRVDGLSTWSVKKSGEYGSPSSTFAQGKTVGVRTHVVDEDGGALSGAQVFLEIRDPGGSTQASLQGFTDGSGSASISWKTSRRQAPGTYHVVLKDVVKNGYEFDLEGSLTDVAFEIVPR